MSAAAVEDRATTEVPTETEWPGAIANPASSLGGMTGMSCVTSAVSSPRLISTRTLTFAVVKGALLLVLLCFRQFRQLAAMLFCLGAGVAGAYFASPYARPYLQNWVPIDFRPDLLAYAAGFLAAYIAALIIVALIRAPFAASRE